VVERGRPLLQVPFDEEPGFTVEDANGVETQAIVLQYGVDQLLEKGDV
jgi:hypothetical protein